MEKVQFSVDDYISKYCSLHQKYANTCTLNGDGDSFGVTDHKGEEILVSTAEKTSAGYSTSSIQNFENESMLDASSILVQRLMVSFKIVKMSLC